MCAILADMLDREEARQANPAVTDALMALNRRMFPRDYYFRPFWQAANAETGHVVLFLLIGRKWFAHWPGHILHVTKTPSDDLPLYAFTTEIMRRSFVANP